LAFGSKVKLGNCRLRRFQRSTFCFSIC